MHQARRPIGLAARQEKTHLRAGLDCVEHQPISFRSGAKNCPNRVCSLQFVSQTDSTSNAESGMLSHKQEILNKTQKESLLCNNSGLGIRFWQNGGFSGCAPSCPPLPSATPLV
jgi:hypothetical protein